MRDYEEKKGFNPIQFGFLGAIGIALVVAALLWFHSSSKKLEALTNELAASRQQSDQLKKEKEDVQKSFDSLTEQSNTTAAQLKKQLQVRESQLSATKRNLDSEIKAAESKLASLRKEQTQAETEIAQLKKTSEQRSLDLKKMQEQSSKLQADLNKARTEAERSSKANSELKRKINTITEGDQAAADLMVQQLAETRQQLKREQEVRKKLEEELGSLKQQMQAQ